MTNMKKVLNWELEHWDLFSAISAISAIRNFKLLDQSSNFSF